MIDGVKVVGLQQIPDERGKIMHMLRCDDPHFEKFGEIYFSIIYPGVVKGWHRHEKMTLNYAVITGNIKLVLFDDRINSQSRSEVQELFIGESNYVLVRIPPKVWNGFKCVGLGCAIVANCSTVPHDPNEITRVDPFKNDIPYNWELKNG